MNKQQYRAEVDALQFSPEFQDRTVARLSALAQQQEEKTVMKHSNWRTGLIAAAVAAAMSVTAYAAVVLLRPQDVAQRAGNPALAAAFESGGAITANETKTVGDYDVTFMGLVSGEGLSRVEGLEGGMARDKSYAVLAYARTDGTPIEEDVPELTVSPLIEGYAPWAVNAWTLGGGTCTFAEGGTLYYLFECDNVEPFADHTVYLAVYPGTHIPPSADTFAISDEGHISVMEGADAAIFVLPLDKSKADPEKVAGLGLAAREPVPEDEQQNGSVEITPVGDTEGNAEFRTRLHPVQEEHQSTLYGTAGASIS